MESRDDINDDRSAHKSNEQAELNKNPRFLETDPNLLTTFDQNLALNDEGQPFGSNSPSYNTRENIREMNIPQLNTQNLGYHQVNEFGDEIYLGENEEELNLRNPEDLNGQYEDSDIMYTPSNQIPHEFLSRFGRNVPPVDPGPPIVLSEFEKGEFMFFHF